jgi:hypothetical protein
LAQCKGVVVMFGVVAFIDEQLDELPPPLHQRR